MHPKELRGVYHLIKTKTCRTITTGYNVNAILYKIQDSKLRKCIILFLGYIICYITLQGSSEHADITLCTIGRGHLNPGPVPSPLSKERENMTTENYRHVLYAHKQAYWVDLFTHCGISKPLGHASSITIYFGVQRVNEQISASVVEQRLLSFNNLLMVNKSRKKTFLNTFSRIS